MAKSDKRDTGGRARARHGLVLRTEHCLPVQLSAAVATVNVSRCDRRPGPLVGRLPARVLAGT